MRTINCIVVHCTATKTTAKVESIQRYWATYKGWRNPGYHLLVDYQGNVHRLALDTQIVNGVFGHNGKSLHIAYIGGEYEDDRSDAQKQAIINEIKKWKAEYPEAKVLGHYELDSKKACPRFDAGSEYLSL